MNKTLLYVAFLATVGCTNAQTTDVSSTQQLATLEMPSSDSATYEVVQRADIQWEPLNPARGDQSPKAGTLWGDRNASTATGFLVEFEEGFSSPPHIHNVTYRGVVLEGWLHNDDPTATSMWMPATSYWTQPKGEAHITAAKGRKNVAYIEIAEGPYLVKPTDEAFQTDERPLNVDASNIIWENLTQTAHFSQTNAQTPTGLELTHLWSDGATHGHMIKLPRGFEGGIYSPATPLRAVVIDGQVNHSSPKAAKPTALGAGGYFGSSGKAAHSLSCTSTGDCVVYLRSENTFKVFASK